MPLTREQCQAALKHVLEVVMDLGPDSEIQRALANDRRTDIRDIVDIPDGDIDDLTYDGDDGTPQMLKSGQRGLLKTFKAYVFHTSECGTPIGDDWMSLRREEFDAFRVGPDLYRLQLNPSVPPPRPTMLSSRTSDPLYEFRKGIKRDMTQFPLLKDEKQWDSWHRSTVATARAQDVSQILDENFTPSSDEDKLVFDAKQKYMYAVFEKTLLTDQGKAYIREHEMDFNAQKVFSKILKYALKSTKASLDSSRLLKYITSARVGDGSWKGTSHSFVLHWQNQVRLYEKQVDASEHFSAAQKRTMLENAVHDLDELRQVKAQADQHKTQTGRALTYEQYTELLKSSASAYDSQFTPKSRHAARAPKRAVYEHDLVPDDAFGVDDYYDIDSSVDVIEAHFHDRSANMSRERWKRLSAETRTKWDEISAEDKKIILGISSKPPPPTPRKANLHEISAYDFIEANIHDLRLGSEGDVDDADKEPESHDDSPSEEATLLAHATKREELSPADLRRVLSSTAARNPRKPEGDRPNKEVIIDGKKFRQVNVARTYRVSAHETALYESLADRGANGGVAGEDVRVIDTTDRRVDIRGIDNHQVTAVPIATCGAVAKSQKGEVILILHQYAYTGRGKTIHSCGQIEDFKNDVNDKSVKVPGGLQRIRTNDGHVFPLNIRDGLPYLRMRPFTDREFDELPHVILTSDRDWDPSVLDHCFDDDDAWYDAISDLEEDPSANLFDEYGNYRKRVIVQETFFDAVDDMSGTTSYLEDVIDECVYKTYETRHIVEVSERKVKPKEPDYKVLAPRFGWLPVDLIKRTFAVTTQYARTPASTVLKKHFKSPFPALNVHRRDEPVATDTVYSDTPAIDDGATSAQLFVGTESLLSDIYGMKTDKQFVNTLEDNIRERGAPSKLVSDRAQVEISNKVTDILRALCIGSWQSEPHQQHQNPAERRYQTIKTMANTILDRTGSPCYVWLLCLMYVCFLLNHTASASLNYATPLQRATGSTPDISPLLRFTWYEPVYYKVDDSDFPSDSREKLGRFVGIAEHVGHAMTFKVLTDDTLKVLYRSNVRSALNSSAKNKRIDLLGGETSPPIIKSRHDSDDGEPKEAQMPIFQPSDLVGRTFLMNPQEDGQRHRARIVRAIQNSEDGLDKEPTRIKFLCSINDDQAEEILSYNEVLDHIKKDQEDVTIWKFRCITAHEGPLLQSHPNWKGSKYNVMVEWETGEITSEPLALIAADDPVTCALYARDNGLLELDGWKRFKSIAKRQKKLLRMANQAKLRSYRTAPKYKYGFEVPRDYQHALQLDKKTGTDRWKEATKLELAQIDEYDVFMDLGLNAPPPDGYKKIRVHLVFDVKHDGRHKARLVADGHLTDIPVESVYSGVVSLRGFRLLVFLAELNGLETWATDIGNAYLEAKTKEKIYIKAGPEFGELEGHTLVIFKSLYGLRSSGLRWHERFADCLREMGFTACKAEPDIWMRKNGEIYEYIAVYVDDLAVAAKDPASIVETLQEKYKFKLKGTGPLKYHLGMNFFRNDEGVLCMAPKQYLDRMMESYERFFGSKPKQNILSPLEKGDHPELDTSELLDDEGVRKYQSLVGAMQWAVSIGRIDITTAVMTMSSFRAAPRQGHLDRVKRIYGYLAKMRKAVICIRTQEPDYSAIPDQHYDWEYTVYGEIQELLPKDAPEPLGKPVLMTSYVDANLYHDMTTGRSVTGILHLLNQTPIDWYSKKQNTVETATYGSEFVAARTCVEQVIDLRTTLRYLGVPIRKRSYMFGDNKSVVDSSTRPHSKLHKRHTALSFHRVREAIASKIIGFFHIPGSQNPADILSKHWGHQQVWELMKPLMFWHGDTIELVGPMD